MFKRKINFSLYPDSDLEQVVKNNCEINNKLADLEDKNDWHRQVRDNAINEACEELDRRRSIRNILGL